MGTKTNPGTYDCYANALPDEPMFVLLARDDRAPALVEAWAEASEKRGTARAKVAEARACAASMRAWCLSAGRINPDDELAEMRRQRDALGVQLSNVLMLIDAYERDGGGPIANDEEDAAVLRCARKADTALRAGTLTALLDLPPVPDLHAHLAAAWISSGLPLGKLLVLAADKYALGCATSLPGLSDQSLVQMVEWYVASPSSAGGQESTP